MDISKARLDSLVSRLSEGLNVEIKTWIDPKVAESIAKITKAVIALYNRNGGYLIIGFDNKTLLPDKDGAPSDVKAAFHVDVIQGIVSKYSSISIEIQVGFVELEGLMYPVIAVPQGVTVPAAAKRDLLDQGRKPLIREDTVYFRTLGSNGTPSTSAIKAADWRDLLEICFDNREADIGRFLRRQGVEGANIFSLAPKSPTLADRTRLILQEGARSRELSIEARKLDPSTQLLLQKGSWEVALVFDPPKDVEDSSKDFLVKVDSANPEYTGWPAWLVSTNFQAKADRPYKLETAWEYLVLNSGADKLDFYRMHARGQFYQSRILLDDLTPTRVEPGTVLDPRLVAFFVAEVIAVGLRFVSALSFDADAKLGFMFRWNGLRGRHIDNWLDRGSSSPHQETREDTIESYVEVPADTPVSSIAPYVHRAISKLLGSFGGFELKADAIEIEVSRLLKRK